MLKLSDISFVEETYIDPSTPGFKKIDKPNNESVSIVIALLVHLRFKKQFLI